MSPIPKAYTLEDNIYRKKLYSRLKESGFVPEKGSQIYVTGIPLAAKILDLFEFFRRIGDVYEVKLLMDSDGFQNRGFAYVTYMNKQLAEMALVSLKGQRFFDGTKLHMQPSVDNCRIFVGGIPPNKTKAEIHQQLLDIYRIRNIVDVLVYETPVDPSRTRGFAFLEFRTHEEASYFRAKYGDKLFLFGLKVNVDWALPLTNCNKQLRNVKILFIRNLKVQETTEAFSSHILSLIDSSAVQRIHKHKDFAYIHMETREKAEMLLSLLKRYYQGTSVECMFAQPPNKFTDRHFRERALKYRRGENFSLPQHFNLTDMQNLKQPLPSPGSSKLDLPSTTSSSCSHMDIFPLSPHQNVLPSNSLNINAPIFSQSMASGYWPGKQQIGFLADSWNLPDPLPSRYDFLAHNQEEHSRVFDFENMVKTLTGDD